MSQGRTGAGGQASILVNGEARALPEPAALAEVVASWRGGDVATPYAVCVNDRHVPHERIGATTLKAGDSVDLYTIRQGG